MVAGFACPSSWAGDRSGKLVGLAPEACCISHIIPAARAVTAAAGPSCRNTRWQHCSPGRESRGVAPTTAAQFESSHSQPRQRSGCLGPGAAAGRHHRTRAGVLGAPCAAGHACSAVPTRNGAGVPQLPVARQVPRESRGTLVIQELAPVQDTQDCRPPAMTWLGKPTAP